ncbi:MAG: CapA family protein, partial [Streptosporangiaceae bacterium]
MTGLLALLAAACSGVQAPAAAPAAERTEAHARASGAPSPQPTLSPGTGSRSPGPVTLAFAGDVHFTGRTARLLKDPATAFGPISSVLKSAEFTAVNLETAVTSRGRPQPKTYHFRTTPEAFTALRDGGVDLVTMA